MADVERHPDTVDLAEYAEGLLDASHRQAVEDHVRDCADCSTVLTDLADVPDLLAEAPLPPLPADIAARLDQAIAAEATARASEWSGTAAAQAAPIRRTHRWLAPLAAAAAVIAVIAIAIPVVDKANDDEDTSGGESAASGVHQESGDDEAAGAQPKGRAPAAAAPSEPVSLSSATFGQDVIDAFYPDAQASALKRSPLAAESDSRSYYESQLDSRCPFDRTQTTSVSRLVSILFDGRPAYLLLNHAGRLAEAVAFTCDGAKANLLASAAVRVR